MSEYLYCFDDQGIGVLISKASHFADLCAELAGQAENLAAEKMDRIDSISRQYLEKSIGEISMEFAAALQRHRQEINRYLNDKAQADVLMDMEGCVQQPSAKP